MNVESIIAKIRALLSKTVDAGCSPEEALAAADKARDLMDKYDIEHARVLETGEAQAKFAVVSDLIRKDRIFLIVKSINKLAHTSARTCTRRGIIIFAGLDQDVGFATYLFGMLRDLRDREYNAFKKRPEYRAALDAGISGQSLRQQFSLAYSMRITKKVDEMMDARTAKSGTNALVPLKNALAEQFFADKGLSGTKKADLQTSVTSVSAFKFGDAAGEKAILARPLEQSSESEKIANANL